MAKAGLLFIGTKDGVVQFSNPGAVGRWLRVGHELRGQAIVAVWARPDDPLAVVACGAAGIWRSTDGGAAWVEVSGAPSLAAPGGSALVALAGNEPVLLLGGAVGAWRSADNGASWEAGEPDAPWSGTVRVIAPAPYHIDTTFAGTSGGQLYQSTDRGRTWQLLKDGLPPVLAISAARLV
jgi:photosystem II stability/assembly factor-like uncharacterized protein